MKSSLAIVLVAFFAGVITAPAEIDPSKLPPASTQKDIAYAKDIKPLLEASCFRCHGEKEQKGGLRLDSLEAVLKGGKEGKVVEAGDAVKSPLLIAVSQLDPETAMPPQLLTEGEEFGRYVANRFELETEYKGMKVQYDNLNALSPQELRDVLPGFVSDTELSSLTTELNAADQRYTALVLDLGENHPDIKRIKELRAQLDEKINARVKGIMKRLETQVATAKARFDSTVEAVKRARRPGQGGPGGQRREGSTNAPAGIPGQKPGGPGGPGGKFPSAKPLTPEQVGLIRAWIDRGAK